MPLFEVEEGVELYYEVSGNCDAPNKILCVMGMFIGYPHYLIASCSHSFTGWATCYKMGIWENQVCHDAVLAIIRRVYAHHNIYPYYQYN